MWTGYAKGYGYIGREGKVVLVHRAAWELRHGPIPAGYELNHKCRRKLCVRLEHLELVTPEQHRTIDADLIAAGQAKGRATGAAGRAAHLRRKEKLPVGVYRARRSDRFEARPTIDGRQVYLGMFASPQAAARVARAAQRSA